MGLFKWFQQLKQKIYNFFFKSESETDTVVDQKSQSSDSWKVKEDTEVSDNKPIVKKGKDEDNFKDNEIANGIELENDVEASNNSSELLMRLREVREEIIAQRGSARIKTFFTDDVLKELADKRPNSKEEILKVKGIGRRTYQRYGKSFLMEINQFTKEREKNQKVDNEKTIVDSRSDKEILEARKDLFQKLKGIRKELVKEGARQSFRVNDDKLKEIVLALPTTKDELLLLSGVGEKTYQSFGIYFIKEVEKFLTKYPKEEKNIELLLNDDYKKILDLAQQGLAIEEIGENLGVSKGRVVGILNKLIRADLIINGIEELVTKDYYKQIKKAMDKIRNYKLSSIKQIVSNEIDYDEIRLVVTYEKALQEDSKEDFSQGVKEIEEADEGKTDKSTEEAVKDIMDIIFSDQQGEAGQQENSTEIVDLDSAINYGLENGYVRFEDLAKLDYTSEEVDDRFAAVQLLDNKNIEILYD